MTRAAFPVRLARALHPGSIAANIPGPIFAKEVHVLGRKASTYWARGLYALFLLGVICIVFVGVWEDSRRAAAAARLQQFQTIAPAVTIAVLWFQYVLITLCAAAQTSGAICEERRKGTLGVLLTTPLRAWQIVLGKIAGGCVQLVVLGLIGVPLLLAVRVFGGVPAQTVFSALALTASSALLAATLAVWHSIHVPRAATALLSALLSFAVIQFAPALVFFILNYYKVPQPGYWFVFTCTPIAMGFVTADMVRGAGAGLPVLVDAAVTYSTLYTLAWTVVTFVAASLNLRWWMHREAAGPATAGPKAAVSEPGAQETDAPPLKGGRRRRNASPHPSREVSDRPVLWRELRQTAFRSRTLFWATLAGCVGLLTFLYIVAEVMERPLHHVITAALSVMALSVAAAAATGAICGELESRTLDSLLSTPMTAREIVVGKFLGALRRLWFYPAIMLGHVVLCSVALQVLRPILALHIVLFLIPPMAALVASGLWMSILFKRSSVAATANLALAMGVWAIGPISLAMAVGFATGGRAVENIFSICALYNPVAMIQVAVGGGFEGNSYGNSQAGRYDLFNMFNLGAGGFTLIAGVFALGYTAMTAMLLTGAASRLARTTGRAR